MKNKTKSFKPVIKWSGSKRIQANEILSYFPKFTTYYDPFLGGGSMLYAANAENSIASDICKPLIDLWNEIKYNPNQLAESYNILWNRLQDEGYTAYYEIRDDFNKDNNPAKFLFLSRTCVNGLIRFNKKGHFNNSLHHSRPGINPKSLEKIILEWSDKVQHTQFICQDYIDILKVITKDDFVYLDPPYYNTKGRYYGLDTINFNEFFAFLSELNNIGVKYALSFDGITNDKDYLVKIPNNLYKRHILIDSGNSSFKKVMNKEINKVKESLYLNY